MSRPLADDETVISHATRVAELLDREVPISSPRGGWWVDAALRSPRGWVRAARGAADPRRKP